MPKISVLMPVYNSGLYLKEAIDSIIHQTFNDWELIIMNDGSTDNSEQIILSYSDPRIRYIKNQKNKGLIWSRNQLINLSLGEYVAFLDSDDISNPERLNKQVAFLDHNLDYALCGTWGVMIDKEGNTLKKINMPSDNESIKCSLLFINTFIQSSIMVRRQVLIDYPYDTNYPLAEDYELWCRLSRHYKLKNLPEHLTLYRWHGTNISQSKKDHLDHLVKLIYKREFAEIGLEPSEKELSLHSSIRDKTIELNIPPNKYFIELKTWLIKLGAFAAKSDSCNPNWLKATIDFRWIFACKERKKYKYLLTFPVHLNLNSYNKLLSIILERMK